MSLCIITLGTPVAGVPSTPVPLHQAQRHTYMLLCRGKWGSADKAEVDEMLSQGKPHCYRFRVPANETVTIKDSIRGEVSWNSDSLGDFVVLRSNGLPVYNFCVAIDDGLMKISHVIRAEEHLPNTLRQVMPCSCPHVLVTLNPAMLLCWSLLHLYPVCDMQAYMPVRQQHRATSCQAAVPEFGQLPTLAIQSSVDSKVRMFVPTSFVFVAR